MASSAEQAVALKDQGNELFKAKKYPQAIDYYTQAIEMDGTVASFYTNRAQAYIKSEGFGAALLDANMALSIDNTFVKAYYRRATARYCLGKPKEALKDYKAVAQARPNDKGAAKKAKEVEKEVNRMAFERAISVKEKSPDPITKRLRGTMISAKVEASYEGPVLEGEVTMEFMLEMMAHFKAQKKLHRKVALDLLLRMAEILEKTGNLPDIPIPAGGKFTVCGDTHGQFFDVCNIFEINGLPSKENPYLFNGDFVDRGSFSTEVIFTMFGFHILFPDHFHMSRGNHETINMNKMYGFDGEVKAKYTGQMCEYFTEVYNLLPLGHIINHKVMVVHGGLFSEDGVKLEDIRKVDRKQQPDSGLMCEMLWSDPQHQMGRSPSKRGVGTQFGPDVTKRFLDDNGLELLIRSHEVKDRGYEVMHDGKCITIFSAPNYCDQMGNKGAFITLKEDCKPVFTEFDAVPHPDVKCMAYAGGAQSMFGF